MNGLLQTAVGVLIPLLGTVLGAAAVFFIKNALPATVRKVLLGFAAGVMLAASVWSLLLPAIELAENAGGIAWGPAVLGFLLGAGLLLLDEVFPLPRLNPRSDHYCDERERESALLTMAVTLHNIPEGMAVGVALAGLRSHQAAVTAAGTFALIVGVAIQNIPEGAIISLPLACQRKSRGRAFLWGCFSGVVEPISAVLALLLTALVEPALPYVLSFAAGAMFYVAAGELLPEARSDGRGCAGILGAALGFALMMLLDVALG